jgi:hypothetical protein
MASWEGWTKAEIIGSTRFPAFFPSYRTVIWEDFTENPVSRVIFLNEVIWCAGLAQVNANASETAIRRMVFPARRDCDCFAGQHRPALSMVGRFILMLRDARNTTG